MLGGAGIDRRWQAALIGLAVLLLVAIAFARATPGSSTAPASPDTEVHMGVASCAGSTCHGRGEPTGAVVRQDELRIWQDDSSPAGAHSRAWR
ncbi:MAG TPA: hypothetical protein VFL92_05565, partial [Sphingomonas sp.]|nr:hypothetical protein [Sphingomonas sp.]